jgi:hypothetical protein
LTCRTLQAPRPCWPVSEDPPCSRMTPTSPKRRRCSSDCRPPSVPNHRRHRRTHPSTACDWPVTRRPISGSEQRRPSGIRGTCSAAITTSHPAGNTMATRRRRAGGGCRSRSRGRCARRSVANSNWSTRTPCRDSASTSRFRDDHLMGRHRKHQLQPRLHRHRVVAPAQDRPRCHGSAPKPCQKV